MGIFKKAKKDLAFSNYFCYGYFGRFTHICSRLCFGALYLHNLLGLIGRVHLRHLGVLP